ncbi:MULTISPECIES: ROK family transcriptional regulator [unclassified Streptomyces]|uniref:ROK family transcriptional regulator n=1 Tax=unclassified Streptomyces TaxID=2593676 RepID=UPI000C2780AC|nr:ROK family transcriptional regulator [Streptomyces sp. CB01201]PJN04613.1 sugar kinase [Streptomyces sp. CB01201]
MATPNRRTVRDLRRDNRSAVLRRLYFDGPMSRQALGPATGLSSGSVSNVVAELVADGLLEDAGVVDSDGGRPRTLLRVAPGCGHLIGVDVGETRVRVELFDLVLRELARVELSLDAGGYDVDHIVGHIREGVAAVLHESGLDPARLLGVGVGVPGIVDRSSPDGAVVHGQTIGWDAVPLESLLRESLRLPADTRYFIENGTKTLGQAELWFGGGRGASDAAIVLFGSGVGACIISGGAIYGGAHSSAAEWGHTTVHVRGRRCRCGALGCLEAYAGAEALIQRWREAGAQLPPDTGEETAVTALLAAAYPTDPGVAASPVALGVIEETAEYLGAGLSDLINLYNPERILIGGWAGLQLGPHILESVRRHATAYALRHPAERVTIELGRLGPDAVTVGAATLPLAGFFARGGRRAPATEQETPAEKAAWRTAVEERAAR